MIVLYKEFIKTSDWKSIIQSYDVDTLAKLVPFKEGIILSCRMLYNKGWDWEIQNYATDFLQSIRKNNPEKWNSCWKLDILLGLTYEITMRYEEKYLAYKSASLKVSPIPPFLMVLLAECYISPGTPPVSRKEAKKLLLEALALEKTIEGVGLIKHICELDENWDEVEYWDKILNEVTEKDIHSENLYPSFVEHLV